MSALVVVVIAVAAALAVVAGAGIFVLPLFGLVARHVTGLGRLHAGVAVLPWLLGALVALAVLVPGDPHTGEFLACHCADQPGWWHLCAMHPWSSTGLLVPAALVLLFLLPGLLRRALVLLREPLGAGGGATPRVLDLAEPVVLLHGWLRPGLLADRTLWSELDEQERAVVVAHEQGHLARRDPAVLMLLRVLVLPVPAIAARPFLTSWLAHAEREADVAAALAVGDPLLVADTLLRAARRSLVVRHTALAWTGASLEDRVQSLLAVSDERLVPPTPDVSWLDGVLLLLFGLGALTTVPWLHHQLEHLLNLSL